jgi:hypothetical protein
MISTQHSALNNPHCHYNILQFTREHSLMFSACYSLSSSLIRLKKVKVTLRLTVIQSVSLGVEPHLGLMTRYLLLFDSYGLVLWAASLTRKQVCFCISCWPLLEQFFSGPSPFGLATIFYCLKFETSFSSPPTTLRVTVEVLDPASTRVSDATESYVTTDGQSASLSWYKAPVWGLRPDFYFRSEYGIRLTVTFLIPWDDGSVFCMCHWPLPAQSFSGPSPLGLEPVFYCLRFETSLFVASYDSQGHGGGIRPRLHTGL